MKLDTAVFLGLFACLVMGGAYYVYCLTKAQPAWTVKQLAKYQRERELRIYSRTRGKN